VLYIQNLLNMIAYSFEGQKPSKIQITHAVQVHHHDNAFSISIHFSVHVYPGNLTYDLSIAIAMLFQVKRNHLIAHSVFLWLVSHTHILSIGDC